MSIHPSSEELRDRVRELESSLERLRREQEQQRQEHERWQRIARTMVDAITVTDLDGEILYTTPSPGSRWVSESDELEGKSILDVVHPDDYERVRQMAIGCRERCRPGRVEFRYLKSDGTFTWVETIVDFLRADDGEPREVMFITRDISRRRQDQEELARAHASLAEEIEERRRVEEENHTYEQRLVQAQKMEAIGTLAGGIAHDFNNLLMGIQGNCSLMFMEITPDQPVFEKLKSVEHLVHRGADLTRQLLGFARGGKYEVATADMNDLIERSAGMFARTRKELSIRMDLASDLWHADVDRGQIEQVLINLYVNAWQAMPDGGDLLIESQNVVFDDGRRHAYQVKPGRHVMFAVTDTGCGMSSEIQRRIFEPFFTTKEKGIGTGLGLASAYGIIKNHGGCIDVYSEPGVGSTFKVYLPASESGIVGREDPDKLPVVSGTGTVLIVDDEDMIIDVARDMLESLGYNVLAANDGGEALAVMDKHGAEVDLVLLDMIMPHTDTPGLFDAIHEGYPQVKVLLSSGYSLGGKAREIMSRGCDGFIQKPYSLSLLSRRISTLLNDPPLAVGS